MRMLVEIDAFVLALGSASGAAKNTVDSYRRDLIAFRQFLLDRGSTLTADNDGVALQRIDADHIRQYLGSLDKTCRRTTLQRRLSAIKAFFRHLELKSGLRNPAAALRAPKAERRLPSFLQE